MPFNPNSEAGVDGIAQRLDAQGFAPTKAVLKYNTAEEAQSPERQSDAARPPLPFRSSGSMFCHWSFESFESFESFLYIRVKTGIVQNPCNLLPPRASNQSE